MINYIWVVLMLMSFGFIVAGMMSSKESKTADQYDGDLDTRHESSLLVQQLYRNQEHLTHALENTNQSIKHMHNHIDKIDLSINNIARDSQAPVISYMYGKDGTILPSESAQDNSQKTKHDKILDLKKRGMSSEEIGKKLGIGSGEVELVVRLYSKGVAYETK